jgi:hypothetical protein
MAPVLWVPGRSAFGFSWSRLELRLRRLASAMVFGDESMVPKVNGCCAQLCCLKRSLMSP